MRAATSASRGSKAETQACDYLQRQGLRLIDRNIRCRFGEIDLVMQKDALVVFVEVRYRRTGNPISAAQSVDARKQKKLALTASWYLSRTPRLQSCPVRFDVVAMDGRPDGQYALQWIEDAFRPGA